MPDDLNQKCLLTLNSLLDTIGKCTSQSLTGIKSRRHLDNWSRLVIGTIPIGFTGVILKRVLVKGWILGHPVLSKRVEDSPRYALDGVFDLGETFRSGQPMKTGRRGGRVLLSLRTPVVKLSILAASFGFLDRHAREPTLFIVGTAPLLMIRNRGLPASQAEASGLVRLGVPGVSVDLGVTAGRA